MEINTAKTKMQAGKPAIGGGAGLGSPLGAEILALSGIDLVMWMTSTAFGNRRAMLTAFRGAQGCRFRADGARGQE